jgi:hypothetical protein
MSAEERAAMGASGREYVSRHYSREALARGYMHSLETVVRCGTSVPNPGVQEAA